MRARTAVVVAVGVLMIVVTSCDLRTLAIPGDAPVRYRDQVFANVTKTSNIAYGSAVDQKAQTQTLLLDMYAPTGDTNTGRPAIVWVHGGSFTGGDKTSAELVDESNYFSRQGYVNVSINYRLSPTGCFPVTAGCLTGITDAKHDAQGAVRFLRANAATYGIDPTRIAIGGSSAGAITALNVAYGPEDVGDSGNPGFPSTVRAALSLSGAAILTTPSPGEAAALLFHGDADPLVPYSWATSTVTNATNAGLTVYLTTFAGAGHVPYLQNRQTILDQTTDFVYWTMDLAHAAT
jgi:para-nitrobenzyl esterase